MIARSACGIWLLAAAALAPELRFEHRIIDAAGPADPWGKASGDINGDGRPDLLIGGWRSGGLVWYENPSWTKHSIDAQSQISTDIEVADIDGDGRNDVVAITGKGIVWYRNPRWEPATVAPGTLHDIEVADLDGDGDLDIVGRNQGAFPPATGSTLFLYEQRTPAEWRMHSFPVPNGEGLAVADMDGDGAPDAVLGSGWYRNPRDLAKAWTAIAYAGRWTHANVTVAVGDVNRDGRPDIALAPAELAGSTYRISWFEAPARPHATPWREFVVEEGVETVHHAIVLADFDGDGETDLASAEMQQGKDPDEVKVYRNLSRGKRWRKQAIGAGGSHSLRTVDVDGDGKPDLLGANHQGTRVELWKNTTPKIHP